MGARTDAARAEVLAGREAFSQELDRLEASGRAAVDVPARVRREPVKTVGAAAGAVFLLAGGPRRVFRRVKRFIVGPEQRLPESMLPEEIDKALRKLGTDGDRVRGTIEREFAKYLEEHDKERKERDLNGVLALLLTSVAKPVSQRLGRRLAEEVAHADSASFEQAVERVRKRREAGKGPEVGR